MRFNLQGLIWNVLKVLRLKVHPIRPIRRESPSVTQFSVPFQTFGAEYFVGKRNYESRWGRYFRLGCRRCRSSFALPGDFSAHQRRFRHRSAVAPRLRRRHQRRRRSGSSALRRQGYELQKRYTVSELPFV